MIIHQTPHRKDKQLSKAYNEAFERLNDDDWLVVRDTDTMFLTNDAPDIIEEYVRNYPDAGIFTCYTNRLSEHSRMQLYGGKISQNTNIISHIRIAEALKRDRSVSEINQVISGMLMVISKKTWDQYKFFGANCLGVDYNYAQQILDAGLKIYRMNGIYIWHTYRLLNGVNNKNHLMV